MHQDLISDVLEALRRDSGLVIIAVICPQLSGGLAVAAWFRLGVNVILTVHLGIEQTNVSGEFKEIQVFVARKTFSWQLSQKLI